MTRNPRNPQEEDDKRRIAQYTSQICLQIALEQNDMKSAEQAFDAVCDYTAARVVARKSGWLPLKGE